MLNRINRVLISRGASSFLEAYLVRTSKLRVLGLEQFRMGDRPGTSKSRALIPLMRTRENFPVGHPYQIATSEARLT
jgi:hypothetical protein